MSVWDQVGRMLRPPKIEDITNIPREVKEHSQKGKMNNMDIILLDRDFTAGDEVNGEISRRTKFSVVRLKSPEPLAFFKIGSFYNRTRGRQMMICVEDYPYGLELGRELADEEHNMIGSGEIRNGIKLPVLLDKLPYYVEKQDTEKRLKKLTKDNYFELTPSLLSDLGNDLFLDALNDNKTGMAVVMCMGVLVGMVLMALLTAFAKGG